MKERKKLGFWKLLLSSLDYPNPFLFSCWKMLVRRVKSNTQRWVIFKKGIFIKIQVENKLHKIMKAEKTNLLKFIL